VGIGELHPDRRREHGHGRGGPRSDRRCGSGGAPPRVTAVMSAGESASAGELCHHCQNEKRVKEVTRYERELAAARPRPRLWRNEKYLHWMGAGREGVFFYIPSTWLANGLIKSNTGACTWGVWLTDFDPNQTCPH
jgi:hypothetical protein